MQQWQTQSTVEFLLCLSLISFSLLSMQQPAGQPAVQSFFAQLPRFFPSISSSFSSSSFSPSLSLSVADDFAACIDRVFQTQFSLWVRSLMAACLPAVQIKFARTRPFHFLPFIFHACLFARSLSQSVGQTRSLTPLSLSLSLSLSLCRAAHTDQEGR
jgi:hypothetical protein